MYIYIYIFRYKSIYICIYVDLYICMCVCLYVYLEGPRILVPHIIHRYSIQKALDTKVVTMRLL